MSNMKKYNEKIAFHPGYYVKEIVDESGLTQEDFAKRLGTTPKNLSVLINGDQSLSIDMAAKLSRMLGTSIAFWLNLQKEYDEKIAEFQSQEELIREKETFKLISYRYFVDNFGLPDISRKTDLQIKYLREFLNISSLKVLEEKSLMVDFRSDAGELSRSNIVNANAMIQIAINVALKADAPKFNRTQFEKAVAFALTQTRNHDGFLFEIKEAFRKAGVILVVLPNLKNSGVNGATKKVGDKVVLMVNDRRHYSDTFWFTLFHEIGHIMNKDYGISMEGKTEDLADLYAMDKLIPTDSYDRFLAKGYFDERTISEFAVSIDRDPGIVLGRLMKDGYISHGNKYLSNKLRHTYTVVPEMIH